MTASKKILMGYYENEIKVLEEDGFAQFYSNGSLMFTKSISYKNEEFTIGYIPSYIFGSKRTVSITGNNSKKSSSEDFGESKSFAVFNQKDLTDIVESMLLLYKFDGSRMFVENRYTAPSQFTRQPLFSTKLKIQKRYKGNSHRVALNILKKHSGNYYNKAMEITLENFDKALEYFYINK